VRGPTAGTVPRASAEAPAEAEILDALDVSAIYTKDTRHLELTDGGTSTDRRRSDRDGRPIASV
jgi:hypothetical protein